MSEQLKTIKDIFSDFETEEELYTAKIKNVNLYKKTNVLSLCLISDIRINLKNIYLLENYLKKRFNVKDVEIKIENNNEININTEWNNIITYINIKYPLTKAILINNTPEISEKKIIIKLAVTGKDFLTARGFEKILENLISNFYGKEYKVDFVEQLDKELVRKMEENTKRVERMAIELAEQEIVADLSDNNKEDVGARRTVPKRDK